MYTVVMPDIRFEWDGKKQSLNKRKHGLSFAEAQTALLTKTAYCLMTRTILAMKIALSFSV